MVSKLSDRLQAMVDQDRTRTAPVHVRLRAGLSRTQLKNAVRKLEAQLSEAEYVPISGTVHGSVKLSGVAGVSALPEVEWIDVEREVPIEELIDPM